MKTVDVSISVPVTIAFGEHLSRAPYQSTTIEIYRIFVANPDTDAKLIFVGTIHNVSIKNNIATGTCRSTNRTLSRTFPRFHYQTTCNHMIYDEGCGLLRENNRLPVTVGLINGAEIFLNELQGMPDQSFQGGIMEYNGEERLITSQVDGTVTVLIPFTGLSVGNEVNLYPGCDGNPGTCRGYNNIDHFFGMPYIPTRNPILWGFR